MKVFKALIKILCLILAVGLVFTGVFFYPNSVRKLKIEDSFFDYSGENKNFSDNFEKIASSGFIELYFNPDNGYISVLETSENFMWYAVPDAYGSMLEADVYTEKGNYILTSNGCEFEKVFLENGVEITYNIKKDDMFLKAALTLTLKDGSLFVQSEIKERSDNFVLNSFSVMPSFGAYNNPQSDDFLLVPDGCGSVIYPYLSQEKQEYSVCVYGDDYSINQTNNADAIIGSFGIKRADSAVAVIIDSGEEFATIKALSDKNGFSAVSAYFKIQSNLKNENELYYYNDESYEIAICYKFLSGDNASYSEIACSCREQYIRNGSLPSSNVKAQDNTPFFITLTGSYKKSAWSSRLKYTTFSQAVDILNRLKSKGIDVMTARYTGVIKNGSTSLVSALGSKSELENLYDFATAQNISLFLDVNINAYQSAFGVCDFSSAKMMNKSTSSTVENTLIDKDIKTVKYRFSKLNDINNYVSNLIKTADGNENIGYCIGDAEYLVSNFSSRHTSRADAKNTVSSQIPALSNSGEVMVDKGNMYLVKNASSVVNIPMKTHYPENESYVAVPFAQSVLHGRITMASTPINLNNDERQAALKCIEYGVCPSFTVSYSGEDLSQNVIFDKVVNDIVESYSLVSKALIGIESERITLHKKLADGVYLTQYADTADIYVNYNDFEVTVSGVSVPAESYLRID